MADAFDNYAPGLDSPANDAAVVTPGATPLANVTRALWIGVAGNVTVTMLGGQTITFSGVPAGTVLPVRVTHVTAAAGGGVVALW